MLISSSCPFLTVCELDRTCKRLHEYGLPHELTLVRRIADTIHQNSRFDFTTIWSAKDLNLEQAKAVCCAGEMIIKSIEEPEVSLTSLLKWWVTLAIHSHPLISALDVNGLQFCLHIARYYKLENVIPDISFCIVASCLGRPSSDKHFSKLGINIPEHSESLVVIAFLAIQLQLEANRGILNHPLPRIAYIPIQHILGGMPSVLTKSPSIQRYDEHLQSLASSSFFELGEWVGVCIHGENNTVHVFDSVTSITRNGQAYLVVIGILNGIDVEAVANTFVIMPFGIVFYWEFASGIVWLWKKEWCGDELSNARLSGSQTHQPTLMVRSNSTILLRRLIRFVDPFNYNELGF